MDTTVVDRYISEYPDGIRKKLEEIRAAIKSAAPEATEKISYGMPTLTLNGNLVHFAACKGHIGFYPTPSAIVQFATELASYRTSKGAVQFPIEDPLPLDLIKKMVLFRVAEQQVTKKPPKITG
jgi:uncharacterized protein YdhG (YjbR/CyaY superfamily)